jgi:proteasome alpha subunit
MPITPYEWNESIRQRNEYIEDRLRGGSPVTALSFSGGLLMLSVRQTQRKIYEIYDRLIFSAIGNQADIETVRTGAIDVAHKEGYTRSPDDVSIQRIVGFAVSPAIKKVYSDSFAAPIVIRALFAELGKTADRDHYYAVGYDGEFTGSNGCAAIAGNDFAEEKALSFLENELKTPPESTIQAVRIAVKAWAVAKIYADEPEGSESDQASLPIEQEKINSTLKKLFEGGWIVEAALLERETKREIRYATVSEEILKEALAEYY